jgi:putative DNA methylase
MWEIQRELDIGIVLEHLMESCKNYLQIKTLLSKKAEYLANKRDGLKPEVLFKPEASAARVLAEAIRNHRL